MAGRTQQRKKQPEQESIEVFDIELGEFQVGILGRTPLICNRLSEKAKRELLLPSLKKGAAEKAVTLKHRPYEEFRDSIYTDKRYPETAVLLPATTFKAALASVALDMPGSTKAQLGRLTNVAGDYVSVYGRPHLFMAIVRQADAKRTPDVRTRAILPDWGCLISVRYVMPILNREVVQKLIGASGIMRGVGDWRVEKGKGDYGQFEVVAPTDKRLVQLMKTSKRDTQQMALDSPEPYDQETADLLSWYDEQVERRGLR